MQKTHEADNRKNGDRMTKAEIIALIGLIIKGLSFIVALIALILSIMRM